MKERRAEIDPASGASNTPEARVTAPRGAWQGSLREWFESLPLARQFRFAAIGVGMVTLLAVQLVVVTWDTVAARFEAVALAERATSSMARRLQAAGGGALDDLQYRDEILEAALTMDGVAVLQHYVRGRESSLPGTDSASAQGITRPSGWVHKLASAFALEPIYVESTLELGPGVPGTVSILVDNSWIWSHATHRLAQAPIWLLLGYFIALYAGNLMKRQVVDPLGQLARMTRPNRTDEKVTASPARTTGNELRQLAANFEDLSNQLVNHERDLRNLRHTTGQQIIERTAELEGRLRRAELLTQSKDDFLANMSHEIRTPMNGVLGMAELLAGTDLDKRQKRFVDSMRAAAETMMRIINDILDDSKIEAGKMELVRETFDVRDLAEQAGQLYAGKAESKKLEMICRVEPTVPRKVIGDVLRLRQVLGNLLSNAVKYTDKGEIEIRVGVDDIRDGQCRLHFSITDTGPGIPQADLNGVFEAFTQLGNASRVGGTGLGLSIATRLVRLMGGEQIDLRSEVGRGSTFSFVLPFEVSEVAAMPNQASDEFSGMRVLVVEDNATSYILLQETLANWSVEVTMASSAKLLGDRMHDAAIRGKPFEVVLLDHSLPDATTEGILRTIRLDSAIAGTFVVLMSALDYNAAYEGEQAIAPDMCIAKPMGQQLLRSALAASRQPRKVIALAAPGSERRKPGAATTDLSETDLFETGLPETGLPALGLHVLVVDDNAINREVAVAMLEELHCNVDVAEDGRSAVGKATLQRFDVVLMDCQMPGMDGYAATAAIREDERRRALTPTTIVALTANVLARDRERCVEAGMDLFLAKPFRSAQIVETLLPIARERGCLGANGVPAVATPRPPRAAPVKGPIQLLTDTHPHIAAQVHRVAPVMHPVATDVLSPAATATVSLVTATAALVALPPLSMPLPSAPLPVSAPALSDTAAQKLLETPAADASTAARLPVLDLEQVDSIRSIGQPMIFERLCDMLFASSREVFDKLDAALANNDMPAVAAAAHALKSPVSNLGGRRLAELLERCETAALEGRDLAVVQRAATGLKPHYAALVATLEAETRRATGTR